MVGGRQAPITRLQERASPNPSSQGWAAPGCWDVVQIISRLTGRIRSRRASLTAQQTVPAADRPLPPCSWDMVHRGRGRLGGGELSPCWRPSPAGKPWSNKPGRLRRHFIAARSTLILAWARDGRWPGGAGSGPLHHCAGARSPHLFDGVPSDAHADGLLRCGAPAEPVEDLAEAVMLSPDQIGGLSTARCRSAR